MNDFINKIKEWDLFKNNADQYADLDTQSSKVKQLLDDANTEMKKLTETKALLVDQWTALSQLGIRDTPGIPLAKRVERRTNEINSQIAEANVGLPGPFDPRSEEEATLKHKQPGQTKVRRLNEPLNENENKNMEVDQQLRDTFYAARIAPPRPAVLRPRARPTPTLCTQPDRCYAARQYNPSMYLRQQQQAASQEVIYY
jgi:hypothetical protein